jgi:hypothetical protein
MPDILNMITLIIFLGISLALVVPLTGCLVRLRANYNPKGLQLDADGEAQAHTGPVITTLSAMAKRVYRIEGWPGLYKGLMPTILSTIVMTTFIGIFLDPQSPRHGSYRTPNTGIFGSLFYSIVMMVVSLPTVVISYRAITTPHKLPYFNPALSLRVLLTPTERQKPWIIYLTPGLLPAQALHVSYVVLVLGGLRHALLPALSKPGVPKLDDYSLSRFGFFTAVTVMSTVFLTPLEVIATRLSIQRNHAAPEFNSVSQEENGDAEEVAEFAGADEDVIGLRNEADPYMGLVDCAKRIMQEEGWQSLYRAWWLTVLGSLAGVYS